MTKIKWDNLRKVLEEYVEYFIQLAQKNIDDYDAVATGKMRDIKVKDIITEDDFFKITVEIENYFKYVEGGSKGIVSSPPNAIYPAHKPPVQAILDWIDAKGIQVENNLGFAIATTYSILNRGLEPKPFFQDAKEETYKVFEPKIIEAIEKDMGEYIYENITKYFGTILKGK